LQPDFLPTDFYLFGLLKEHLGGKRFDDDEEVKTVVQKGLRKQSKTAMLGVSRHWYSDGSINVDGGVVKKYMFFSSFKYHMFFVLYLFSPIY
jgi:hypothetical protein